MREWRVPTRWQPIPSCPGYEASDYGRIWSAHSKRCLIGSVDRYGYRYVNISVAGRKAKRKVHRLVCEAWHGPCPADRECGHLDGDKENNRRENLAWITRSENVRDQIKHGVFAAANLERTRIGPEMVSEILADAAKGLGGRRLAAKYGIDRSTAHRLVYGRPKADAQPQSGPSQ